MANTVGKQFLRNPRHLVEDFGLPNCLQVADDLQTAYRERNWVRLKMIKIGNERRIMCLTPWF